MITGTSQLLVSRVPGERGTVTGMRRSACRRPWLYDPSLGGVLVRAHRAPGAGAAGSVLSDAVWTDVLGLLRWAEATMTCPPELACGSAWRTAVAAAALLRRLPGMCAEAGVPWPGPATQPVSTQPVPAEPVLAELPAGARLRTAADRLALRLCSPGEGAAGPLRHAVGDLARDVDEIGAAAVAVLAGETDWAGAADRHRG